MRIGNCRRWKGELRVDRPDFLEAGWGGGGAQRLQDGMRWLKRREWLLWVSTLVVTLLALAAFLITVFPGFFREQDKWYALRPDQTLWAVLCLLLLFNSWMVYRQWLFRSWHEQAEKLSAAQESGEALDPTSMDPVTGLYTRASVEAPLGKEIGRVKREKTALSFLALHLDELSQLTARHGQAASIQALKEFAWALKKASRGSDFAARLGDEDFLLVLPECHSGAVKQVLDRIGKVEINCAGAKVQVSYAAGWIDYQSGELPSDLLKRVTEVLRLYHHAGKDDSVKMLARR